MQLIINLGVEQHQVLLEFLKDKSQAKFNELDASIFRFAIDNLFQRFYKRGDENYLNDLGEIIDNQLRIEKKPIIDYGKRNVWEVTHKKFRILRNLELDKVKVGKNLGNYKNIIRIGFLNYDIEKNLEDFKKYYDVVILNDGKMDYINEILKKLLKI